MPGAPAPPARPAPTNGGRKIDQRPGKTNQPVALVKQRLTFLMNPPMLRGDTYHLWNRHRSTVMVDRRTVVKGLSALPLATLLADPDQCRAAAAALEMVTLTTPDGLGVSAALARPATRPTGSVLLIHEWWGLNDQIKTMAADVAAAGYLALAVDLMNGAIATTPAAAQAQAAAVNPAIAQQTLSTWIKWLRQHPDGTGKVATIGWCFGGGWSLQASITQPVDATVIYYGRVTEPAAKLAALKGPVLGHFATRDAHITPAMVEGFQHEMAQAEKALTLYNYDADHAFANPTGANYHREDAQVAWKRTMAFLEANLK